MQPPPSPLSGPGGSQVATPLPDELPAGAVVDLLGALAYGELSAFDHLADDAGLAPTLTARSAMSQMAASEFGHHQLLIKRLTQLGAEPDSAMAPFVAALESYHWLTQPSTWLECVVKAYVGGGMADDFYLEVSRFVDQPTSALIRQVAGTDDRAAFAVREVRAALVADPAVAGRVALWARRLVGEAISQTQHVLADRDSLMLLLVHGAGDLTGVSALMTRITTRHEQRMIALGLHN